MRPSAAEDADDEAPEDPRARSASSRERDPTQRNDGRPSRQGLRRDEEDDCRPGRGGRSQSGAGLMVALLVAGCLLAFVGMGVGGYFLFARTSPPPTQQWAKQPARPQEPPPASPPPPVQPPVVLPTLPRQTVTVEQLVLDVEALVRLLESVKDHPSTIVTRPLLLSAGQRLSAHVQKFAGELAERRRAGAGLPGGAARLEAEVGAFERACSPLGPELARVRQVPGGSELVDGLYVASAPLADQMKKRENGASAVGPLMLPPPGAPIPHPFDYIRLGMTSSQVGVILGRPDGGFAAIGEGASRATYSAHGKLTFRNDKVTGIEKSP